jgi:hypothetical protein
MEMGVDDIYVQIMFRASMWSLENDDDGLIFRHELLQHTTPQIIR